MYKLENKNLSIIFSDIGAEIISLKYNNEEQIFNFDKSIWKYSSPSLFPVVGKFLDNNFEFNNSLFDIPQHGFARILKYSLISSSEDNLIFELISSNDTHLMYPFDFSFRISYTLLDSGIDIKYMVKNKDNETMYFGFGCHPAFLIDNNDNYVLFEKEDSLNRILLNNDGYYTHENSNYNLHDKKIIQNEVTEDTLVFDSTNIDTVSFFKKNIKIIFNIKDFPYLAFWRPNNAPFICIEPWHSHSDFYDSDIKIDKKSNMQSILPNKTFETKLQINFGRL